MNTPKRDSVLRAIASRARGHSRVQTATTTVGLASVVTAGAIALALPGSHSTTSSAGSTSSGSSSAGSSSGTASSGSTKVSSGSSGTGSSGTGSSVVDQLRVGVQLWVVQFQLLGLRVQQRIVRAVVELGHQPFDLGRLVMTVIAPEALIRHSGAERVNAEPVNSEPAQKNHPVSATASRRGWVL